MKHCRGCGEKKRARRLGKMGDTYEILIRYLLDLYEETVRHR